MQGGAGRTTICMNLGYTIAEKKQKNVLLIDFCPNQGMTHGVLSDQESIKGDQTSSQLLLSDFGISHKLELFHKITDRLYLIPASKFLFQSQPNHAPLILKKNLNKICEDITKNSNNTLPNFDYILLDCPSQLSVLMDVIILASNGYLYVGMPDFNLIFSINTFFQYQNTIEKESKSNYPCKGIIINQISRSKNSQNIINELSNRFAKLLINDGMKKKELINSHLLLRKNKGFFSKSSSKELKEYNEYMENIFSNLLI